VIAQSFRFPERFSPASRILTKPLQQFIIGTQEVPMRYIFAVLLLFALNSIVFADGPGVTTAPSQSEIDRLRAQVATLQSENQMLRAQLAAVSGTAAAPVAATTKAASDPDEKPIAGIEGILQGIPHDQMPGHGDPDNGLRHSLMTKWVQDHSLGKMITLSAHFFDTTGLSGGHFSVRVGSHEIAHPYQATIVLSAADASTVLSFHQGSIVHVTGRVKNADVTRVDNNFVIFLDLDTATLAPPN
jgi:hypothetical protein